MTSNQILITTIIFCVFMALVLLIEYLKFMKSKGDRLRKSPPADRATIKQILENQFDYFKSLNQDEQNLFINRVYSFMIAKEWIGKENLVITPEIKTLVSASAVQLTFGLNTYILPHFNTIIIHPKTYLYEPTKQMFKGSVTPKGIIVLSWQDFKEGYRIPDDKKNLGLHEMAHALDLTSLMSDDEYLKNLFARIRHNFRDEYRELVHHRLPFFRSYGATNQREFFAVLIETYFEKPKEFKEKLPELYADMCFLLNQDLANGIHRNYIRTIEKKQIKCSQKNMQQTGVTHKQGISFFPLLNKTLKYSFISWGFITVFFLDGSVTIHNIILLGISLILVFGGFFFLTTPVIYKTDETLSFKSRNGENICFNLFEIISITLDDNILFVYFFKNGNFHKTSVRLLVNEKKMRSLLLDIAKTSILVKIKKKSFRYF